MVNVHEVKSRLFELFRLVEERNERIRVCRDGKPVAEIGPTTATAGNPLRPDPLLSGVGLREDPVAPLTEEDWPDS